MELLEVFPPEINAKLKGKKASKTRLEAFCRDAMSDLLTSFVVDSSGGTNDSRLKTALMALQMVWNEKEELKDECLRLRAELEARKKEEQS